MAKLMKGMPLQTRLGCVNPLPKPPTAETPEYWLGIYHGIMSSGPRQRLRLDKTKLKPSIHESNPGNATIVIAPTKKELKSAWVTLQRLFRAHQQFIGVQNHIARRMRS